MRGAWHGCSCSSPICGHDHCLPLAHSLIPGSLHTQRAGHAHHTRQPHSPCPMQGIQTRQALGATQPVGEELVLTRG